MTAGIKANVDGSAAIQVGGTDVITLTSGGAATFVTSPTTVQAGTAAAPSITFSGDTNTGIYSPGADQVAIATGGTAAVTVNSSQNVGVGTTSPSQLVHMRAANPFLLVEGTAASTGETGVYLKANNNEWILRADNNGSSNFFGIKLGNPSSSSNTFLINSGGTVILSGGSTSATGVGITFPATQSASSNANTLDDYEEGTWTPAIAGGSGTTYTNQNGWYTKVGNLVTIGFDLVINAKGTIAGNAQITGLPFTSGSSPARAGGSLAVVNSTGTAYVFTAVFIDNGVTTMDIYIKTASAISSSVPTGTSFFAAGTQIIASLSYRV